MFKWITRIFHKSSSSSKKEDSISENPDRETKEILKLFEKYNKNDYYEKKILLEDYLKRNKEHGGGSSSSPISSP